MSTVERVVGYLEEHFGENLEHVKRLVRQPSISADGTGMAEMAAMLADLIREAGGEAEIVATPGYPVVYGEINVGAPKTLLVYGMYDVQPVVGEKWSTSDPFAGEVLDLPNLGPCLVNRGIDNSKGPIAHFFNVLRSFRAVGERYPVNLKFMLEGEEELGSRNLSGFVEAYKDRLRADYAFFPSYGQDQNGKVVMHLGYKGIMFLELIARGGDWGGPTTRGIHGAWAIWFHSPAWILLHALTSMMSPDQKHILVDGFYDDVAPPSPEDAALLEELLKTFTPETALEINDVKRFKYDLTGIPLMQKYLYLPNINICGIESGHMAEGTKTLLPHEARAKVDIRMVPNMRPEKVIRLVKDHLARNGYADKIEVRVNQGYPPSKLGLGNNPAAQALVKTYRDLGYEPEIWPHLLGSAPGYLFTEVLKIPMADGGLGHGGRAHSPNEYATLGGMRLNEKSIATFLMNLAAI